MLTYHTLIQSLYKQIILPLFYHDDVQVCISRTRNLYEAGIRVIEFTNRGDYALTNFKAIKRIQQTEYPDLFLAVGTIYSTADAIAFSEAGADIIISPVYSEEVADFCFARQIPYIPGCMTPTEIARATQSGCRLIKLFPASVLDPLYIKTIKDLFPGIHFMPTGGIKPDCASLREWLSAGAVAVGVGAALFSAMASPITLAKKINEILALHDE
ncbi:MAG: bifunctional 4-hydroxy-2-oxoglutarate aldolase/2-dehydro-3-deoxy-phosphogluconate aldolase [Bacteroidetes bacterium]|nr:bifunctional 4-hydroxy-2-oxoglutarate aldolase/2-dehydro-3-deoxy-phosphogluconate aldolase [Bacteroidota bacterium]